MISFYIFNNDPIAVKNDDYNDLFGVKTAATPSQTPAELLRSHYGHVHITFFPKALTKTAEDAIKKLNQFSVQYDYIVLPAELYTRMDLFTKKYPTAKCILQCPNMELLKQMASLYKDNLSVYFQAAFDYDEQKLQNCLAENGVSTDRLYARDYIPFNEKMGVFGRPTALFYDRNEIAPISVSTAKQCQQRYDPDSEDHMKKTELKKYEPST